MTGYAVVSSVRLLRIDSRPTPRLTESPFVTLFIGPVNSLPRRLSIVLRTIGVDSGGSTGTRPNNQTRIFLLFKKHLRKQKQRQRKKNTRKRE